MHSSWCPLSESAALSGASSAGAEMRSSAARTAGAIAEPGTASLDFITSFFGRRQPRPSRIAPADVQDKKDAAADGLTRDEEHGTVTEDG